MTMTICRSHDGPRLRFKAKQFITRTGGAIRASGFLRKGKMMKTRRKTFMSATEALAAFFAHGEKPAHALSDRVTKSTKIEDKIYAGLAAGDGEMQRIENACAEKTAALRTLPRDVFQCFYSLAPRMRDESELTDTAKSVSAPLIAQMMSGDGYRAVRSVCGGRGLPAFEAAVEFAEKISESLDGLFGKTGGPEALDRVKRDEERLRGELADLAEKRENRGPDPALDKKITEKAERLMSKARQAEALRSMTETVMQSREAAEIVLPAVNSAKEKAEETALLLKAWGDGAGDPEMLAVNRDALKKARSSDTLRDIAKYLGRFKEIAEKARRNGYAHGRGEKYTVEFGSDLGRVLTSEFAALASPHTVPDFLEKYRTRRLKQYRRRERITEGCGDIIVCLDESGSARDESAWGKAVALALLDIAARRSGRFALIRFSGPGSFRTDLFIPGCYCADDVFNAAESYLGGGTDFKTPLNEAIRLIDCEGFEKADIVFATDGVCSLSEDFQTELKDRRAARGFTVTGVLLDSQSPGMEFSLAGFCEKILRVSELSREQIAESLIARRA
jgi:uncharacterized protein with von Willebrand factor type A (vWA) domain